MAQDCGSPDGIGQTTDFQLTEAEIQPLTEAEIARQLFACAAEAGEQRISGDWTVNGCASRFVEYRKRCVDPLHELRSAYCAGGVRGG